MESFVTQSENIVHGQYKRVVPSKKTRRRDLPSIISENFESSQATILLAKKREMRDIDGSLQNMIIEYRNRMQICDERTKIFQDSQIQMRDRVTKFEKFIIENDAKRDRAESKVKHERAAMGQKASEIDILKRHMAKLEGDRNQVLEKLEKVLPYKNYVVQCADLSHHQFEEPQSVISRYEALFTTNHDLSFAMKQQDEDIDGIACNLSQAKSGTADDMLAKSSSIYTKQMELEGLRLGVKRAEELDQIMTEKRRKESRDLAQIIMAVKNLHRRCLSFSSTKVNTGGSANNNSNNSNTRREVNDDEVHNNYSSLCGLLSAIEGKVFDLTEVREEFRNKQAETRAEDSNRGMMLPKMESSKLSSKSMISF